MYSRHSWIFWNSKEIQTASPHIFTERYEINANSKQSASEEALHKAEMVHPKASELDVRVTRIMDY